MTQFTVLWLTLMALLVGASLWPSRAAEGTVSRDTGKPSPRGTRSMRPETSTLTIFAAGALILAAFAVATPLVFDEAYYWQWSRHLAWGYYDHPPMIAFFIAVGTRLFGETVAGVRLVPLLFGMATLWLIWVLARRYWEAESPARWALATSLVIPLFALGMTLATPDIPFLFFWALSIVLTVRALEIGRLGQWVLAGTVVGLGLMSKYPMVLIYPALFLGLLHSPVGRTALRRPGPYIAVVVSLVASLPFWVWQVRNAGSGLIFQLRHGLTHGGSEAPGVIGLVQLLASQAGVITPILFGLLVMALGRALKAAFRPSGQAASHTEPHRGLTRAELLPFLVYPLLVPLAVFGGASLLASSGPNWMAPAYVTGAVLLGGELARQVSARARWARGVAWAGMALAAFLSLYAHIEALAPMAPLRGSNPLTRTWGHHEMATWAASKRAQLSKDAAPARVLASDYKLASLLAFYLPDKPETCSPMEKGSGSAYYAWQDDLESREKGLLISEGPVSTDRLSRLFRAPVKLGEKAVVRNGVRIRNLWAYGGTLKTGVCGHS